MIKLMSTCPYALLCSYLHICLHWVCNSVMSAPCLLGPMGNSLVHMAEPLVREQDKMAVMQRGKGLSIYTCQEHVCIELRLVPGLKMNHSCCGSRPLPQGYFPVIPHSSCPGHGRRGWQEGKEALVSTTALDSLEITVSVAILT